MLISFTLPCTSHSFGRYYPKYLRTESRDWTARASKYSSLSAIVPPIYPNRLDHRLYKIKLPISLATFYSYLLYPMYLPALFFFFFPAEPVFVPSLLFFFRKQPSFRFKVSWGTCRGVKSLGRLARLTPTNDHFTNTNTDTTRSLTGLVTLHSREKEGETNRAGDHPCSLGWAVQRTKGPKVCMPSM